MRSPTTLTPSPTTRSFCSPTSSTNTGPTGPRSATDYRRSRTCRASSTARRPSIPRRAASRGRARSTSTSRTASSRCGTGRSPPELDSVEKTPANSCASPRSHARRRRRSSRLAAARTLSTSFVDYTVNGLVIGNIYALLAVGLALIFGVANLINFAHGSVYTIGAYVGWAAITFLHTPLPLTMLIVFAVCALIGVAIERIGLRPLQGTARIAPLLATIGLSFVLDQLVQLICSPDPRAVPSDLPDWRLTVGGVSIGPMDFLIAGVEVVSAALLYVFLRFTKLGCGARNGAGPGSGAADGRQRQCGQQRRLRHRVCARRPRRPPGRHVLQPHRSGHELPGDAQGRRDAGDRRRRQCAGRH